jgi:hypothetical protein
MTQPQPPAPEGGTSAWRHQEEVLTHFEATWYRGERPDLNRYLPEDAIARTACIRRPNRMAKFCPPACGVAAGSADLA